MKVDISDLTRVDGASLSLDFQEPPVDGEPLVEGFTVDQPVGFNGTLTNINGILELDGRLKTGYSVKCYRCLEELTGRIDIKVKESFLQGSAGDDSDSYTYEGSLLDLDKVFKDQIILHLPMKLVCSEVCKGLCPRCGTNLNEEGCQCGDEPVNPRMEALRDFFKNQDD